MMSVCYHTGMNTLTKAEAASLIGISPRQVDRLISEGLLTKYSRQNRVYLDAVEVSEFKTIREDASALVSRKTIINLSTRVTHLERQVELLKKLAGAESGAARFDLVTGPNFIAACTHLMKNPVSSTDVTEWVNRLAPFTDTTFMDLEELTPGNPGLVWNAVLQVVNKLIDICKD